MFSLSQFLSIWYYYFSWHRQQEGPNCCWSFKIEMSGHEAFLNSPSCNRSTVNLLCKFVNWCCNFVCCDILSACRDHVNNVTVNTTDALDRSRPCLQDCALVKKPRLAIDDHNNHTSNFREDKTEINQFTADYGWSSMYAVPEPSIMAMVNTTAREPEWFYCQH